MFEKYRELRKWFYALIVALGPIAIFYGLASHEEVVLWLGVGATILGVPGGTTALSNLTPKTDIDIVVVEEQDYNN